LFFHFFTSVFYYIKKIKDKKLQSNKSKKKIKQTLAQIMKKVYDGVKLI